MGTQGIGDWYNVFKLLSIMSIVTNAGIISFTMDIFWSYSYVSRLWYVFYIVFLILGLRFENIIRFFIATLLLLVCCVLFFDGITNKTHQIIQIQSQRQQFIKSKVIDQVSDKDFFRAETTLGSDVENIGHKHTKLGLAEIPSFPYPFGESTVTTITKDNFENYATQKSPQPSTDVELSNHSVKFANEIAYIQV